MSLAVSYTTHTVEITASGLAVAAIGNSVEVSAYNHVVQVSPLVYQVSVAQAGVPGPTGPGVPLGGTTGQVMVKLSDADLDTGWGSVGVGDMMKSTYDTDGDGKVDAAEAADSVPWSGVTDKPSTYTPSAHKTSHATGGTDVLSPGDIGAATASHNHDGVYATAGHDHSGVYAPATHSHNDLYYTETEINALFNTSTGHDHDGTDSKKITWTNIDSKPSTYAPSSHDNTAHSATYITAAGVTYENLSANGDVGTGSSQVAAGNHGHALTSLSDVSVSSPTDGQVLTWDTGTSRWVAETPAGSVDQGEVVKLAWFWN